METGVFLIKLCWLLFFLYIVKNAFRVLDYVLMNKNTTEEETEEIIDITADDLDDDFKDIGD